MNDANKLGTFDFHRTTVHLSRPIMMLIRSMIYHGLDSTKARNFLTACRGACWPATQCDGYARWIAGGGEQDWWE